MLRKAQLQTRLQAKVMLAATHRRTAAARAHPDPGQNPSVATGCC